MRSTIESAICSEIEPCDSLLRAKSHGGRLARSVLLAIRGSLRLGRTSSQQIKCGWVDSRLVGACPRSWSLNHWWTVGLLLRSRQSTWPCFLQLQRASFGWPRRMLRTPVVLGASISTVAIPITGRTRRRRPNPAEPEPTRGAGAPDPRLQAPGQAVRGLGFSWSPGSGAWSLCHPAQDFAPKGLLGSMRVSSE
jgi:hypothetical protein